MGINILLCGDFYPFPEMEYIIKGKTDSEAKLIFGDLLPYIERSDIAALNIEFPLTTQNRGEKKIGPNLKGNPICITPVCEAGFNLAFLSNNHILDFGIEGMNDTITLLEHNGIKHVGCGKNLAEARIPYIYEKDDIKIAILNFSEIEFNCATELHGGANPLDIYQNIEDIRMAKNYCDHVVVVVHAGQDFNHYPPPFMVQRFRKYATEGASIIACHHSHYISGFEVYNGVPIYYGLGNVIYPKFVDIERNKTIALQIHIDKYNLYAEHIPFIYNKNTLSLLNSSVYNSIMISQIEEISKQLKDPNLLKNKWISEMMSNLQYYIYICNILGIPPILIKIMKKTHRFRIVKLFLKTQEKRMRLLLNLIRRDTHHDALMHILENEVEKNI